MTAATAWLRAQWQARRLAARRRLALLLGREFDPYPVPPADVRLSPFESHAAACARAPLALAWRRAGIADPAAWQEAARAKLAELTGYACPAAPPAVRHERERPLAGGFLRRTLYLRVAEERDVPVNLVWQGDLDEAPRPVMICLQGTNAGAHLSWGEARMPADPLKLLRDADIALQAARRGYLAVCVEQTCFGERRERSLPRRSPTPCVDAAHHALLLGQCLLGERASDVSAVVDWLLAGEHGLCLDVGRIHVMGSSAGGTTALFAAALDERIGAVLAASCIGFVRDTIARRGDREGQNVVPGMLRWLELDDVVALCAPRPFLTISGTRDHIWPYAGAAAVVESAREVYAAMNAAEAIAACAAEGGHRFYAGTAWRAFEDLLANR